MKQIFFLLASFLVLLSSCNEKQVVSKPNSSGKSGEIIVVTTKPQWEGMIGDSIHAYLRSFQYGLPQSEPYFDLINTNKKDFENVFKTFRNVLIVEIDKSRMSKGEVRFHKDTYAKDQFLTTLYGSNKSEILELLSKNRDRIIGYYNNKELSRQIKKNKRTGNKELNAKVAEKYGLNFLFNKDAEIAKSDSSVLWIRTETIEKKGGFEHQISKGILMYTYPYYDTVQLTNESLMNMRDYYLKATIKGSKEHQYVTTDYKFIPPQIKAINFRDYYAKEVRGLWEMENGFMGGPMYSLIVLDSENERIVGVTGYVYAPKFDKREILREVEAEIKSLTFKVKSPKPKA